MTVGNDETVKSASPFADSLRRLAREYQELVRSADQRGDLDDFEASKRKLNRQFVALKPRSMVDGLRNSGHTEAADKLDDLWTAAAMVFNLVDVSIGVEETEVLNIDIEAPYEDAIRALKELR